MADKLCLMLQCNNDKNIFLSKKYLKQLIEFIKEFDIKAHYAKTDQNNIISIEKLPEVFCDQSYAGAREYKIINRNILKKNNNRGNILMKASEIRTIIKETLIKNKKISFKEIQKQFIQENISTSALSNHFSQVRQELVNRGINIIKVKNGLYEMEEGF